MSTPEADELEQHPVLGSLERQSRERLLQVTRSEQARRNRVLFTAGDRAERVWLILEGAVKVTAAASNQREVIFDLLGPGSLVGGEAVVRDQRINNASALREASMLSFPAAAVRTLWSREPDFAVAWIRYFVESRQRLEERMAELAYGNIEDRLYRVLTHLARQHGSRNPKGPIVLQFPLTHQELANLIGATRETTTLAVGRLRSTGAIDFQDRRIVLSDQPYESRT